MGFEKLLLAVAKIPQHAQAQFGGANAGSDRFDSALAAQAAKGGTARLSLACLARASHSFA
jgi:hypothetical protein